MKLVAILAILTALATAGVVLIGRDAAGPGTNPYRGTEPPPAINAPDFDLRSVRGVHVTMRSLRGKVVMLTFLVPVDLTARNLAHDVLTALHRPAPG